MRRKMEPLAADINQRYRKIKELIKERSRGRRGRPPGRTDGGREGHDFRIWPAQFVTEREGGGGFSGTRSRRILLRVG